VGSLRQYTVATDDVTSHGLHALVGRALDNAASIRTMAANAIEATRLAFEREADRFIRYLMKTRVVPPGDLVADGSTPRPAVAIMLRAEAPKEGSADRCMADRFDLGATAGRAAAIVMQAYAKQNTSVTILSHRPHVVPRRSYWPWISRSTADLLVVGSEVWFPNDEIERMIGETRLSTLLLGSSYDFESGGPHSTQLMYRLRSLPLHRERKNRWYSSDLLELRLNASTDPSGTASGMAAAATPADGHASEERVFGIESLMAHPFLFWRNRDSSPSDTELWSTLGIEAPLPGTRVIAIYFADIVRQQCCFASVKDVDELLQPLAVAIKSITHTTTTVILFATASDDLLTLQSFWWNLRQEMASQHVLARLRFVQSVPPSLDVAYEILARSDAALTFHKTGSALCAAAGVPFLQLACDFASVEFADALGVPDNTIATFEQGGARAMANMLMLVLSERKTRVLQQYQMERAKLALLEKLERQAELAVRASLLHREQHATTRHHQHQST